MLEETLTHYDVLDLAPDASPQDIRASYLRCKATYRTDSVALYSLIGPEERDQALKRVEEAYAVLSDPDRRRDYDRNHGILAAELERELIEEANRVVSIDRNPPMDTSASSDDLLVPPTTDFTQPPQFNPPPLAPPPPPPATSPFENNDSPASLSPPMTSTGEVLRSEPFAPHHSTQQSGGYLDPGLQRDIALEQVWGGAFVKKVREALGISIEEMSAMTKISRTYLTAIEEENYPKLPAPVYLRGFLVQVSKILKIPHEKVASSYVARYKAARPDA